MCKCESPGCSFAYSGERGHRSGECPECLSIASGPNSTPSDNGTYQETKSETEQISTDSEFRFSAIFGRCRFLSPSLERLEHCPFLRLTGPGDSPRWGFFLGSRISTSRNFKLTHCRFWRSLGVKQVQASNKVSFKLRKHCFDFGMKSNIDFPRLGDPFGPRIFVGMGKWRRTRFDTSMLTAAFCGWP
jgi:hypothetical protein